MRPQDFHLEDFPANLKQRLWIDVEGGGHGFRVPVLVVRSGMPGPVLGITAAIHGDEYEGVGAIYEFFEDLDSFELAGSVIAVPVANPPAYYAITRTSPLDDVNLARAFPGKADGTPSEVLAAALDATVIAHSTFFIDLHSAGVRYSMPTMAGYYTEDPRSRAAAVAFGAPVLWGHPVIPPGRTLSACLARGIPFLYTEAQGAGRIHPDDAFVYARGLRNLARHLGVMDGPLEPVPSPLHLFGDGNTDKGLQTTHDGFFVPSVRLLDRVEKGAPVGKLLDLDGTLLEQYFAPVGGAVAMLRATPSVRSGDPLFLFAEVVE